MTGHGEPWYLDRLGAELERVAAQQDAAERRRFHAPVPSWRRVALPLAALAAVAIAIALGVALVSAEEERTAEPAPQPAPTVVPDDPTGAALERFDGVYIGEIREATLRQLGITEPPAGTWTLAISAEQRTLTIRTPEGQPDSGGYSLPITAGTRDGITLGPDRGCEEQTQRDRPASVRLVLTRSILTVQHARGGCTREWALFSSTSWRKG